MRTYVLLVAVSTLVGTASPIPAVAAVPPTAVITENFADPDVLRVDGGYVAYSTTGTHGRVQTATAPTATGPWTLGGDALPTKPSWTGDGGFWAPDVSRRADGTFLLYYSGPSATSGRMCIGAATSLTPSGPFQPVGDNPVICAPSEGGQIDPASFVDIDGTRYLLYKNEGKDVGKPMAIWLQQMTDDGITVVGAPVELIRADHPVEAGVVEAPVLIRRASQYVLLYSAGSFTGDDYFTSYAVSPTLKGKYTKAPQALMTTESFDGAVRGPGGADFHRSRVFFHGWANGARWMYTAELGWANDVPVVRGSRTRYEAERGVLHNAQIRSGVPNASRGEVVGQIDHPDSWVAVTVFAPTPGTYTAHISYAAGYGDAEHTVTVNGMNQFTLS